MKNTTAKSRIKPFRPAKSRLRKDMYVSPSKKQGASFLMGIILGGSYLVYSEYRLSTVVDAYNGSIPQPVQCFERQSRDLSTPDNKTESRKQSFSIVPKAQAYEELEAPKTGKKAIQEYIIEVFGEYEGKRAIEIVDKCENGRWDTNAVNWNRNGTWDAGIMMINSVHGRTMEDMKDYKKNIDQAKKIFDGRGWTAWACADVVGVTPFHKVFNGKN